MSAFPNFHEDPRGFQRVTVGGVLIRAPLVEIDGIKVEAKWDAQPPTGHDGVTWAFKGMQPAGPHKLTFRTLRGPGVTPAQCFSDLVDLFDRFGPKPTSTGTGASKDSPYTIGQTKNASSDGSPVPTTPGGSSTTDKDGFPKSTGVNPGPRPPTLTVENHWLALMKTTAISMKSIEFKPGDGASVLCILEVIPQKPPTQAGTGVAPPKGDAFTIGATKDQAGGAGSGAGGTMTPDQKAAAAGAAT